MRQIVVATMTMALALGPGSTMGADENAPATGAFSPAGDLHAERGFHTAILQPDGTVLIVGGYGVEYMVDYPAGPPETWDPATASFTALESTAEIPTGTLTPLADGRVLVIDHRLPGGEPLGTAKVWDPATDTAIPTGSLEAMRRDPTTLLLADGRVHVVGGWGTDGRGRGRLSRSAEIWDPEAGTFDWTGGLPVARDDFTATLLPDGRVLVVGGSSEDERLARRAQVWDPAIQAFDVAGKLAEKRMGHTATLLPDGRVLVIGGTGIRGNLLSAEVWDPATETFAPAGSLAERRTGHTATLLPDGRVLVVGGQGWSGGRWSGLVSAEVWDPTTASFTTSGSLAHGRTHHTATPLPDGRVLVVGGDGGEEWLASAEIWDPEASPVGDGKNPRPKAVRRELRQELPPYLDCRTHTRSEAGSDPFARGAVAAIICNPTARAGQPQVLYLALYRFHDARSMDEYWSYRQTLNPRMDKRPRACADGKKGYGTWTFGEYFCYVSKSSGEALIRWTDEATDTYGVMNASARDLAGLWDAWRALGPMWPRPVEV